MVRALEHLSYEASMKDFNLEKGRICGDLMAAFRYVKPALKKDGERLFSKTYIDRTRGNDFQLKEL